jgi:uncharacterized membrane protein YccC
LVLLSVAQSNPLTTALDRLIDVAIGGAISVVAYVLWPTSPRAGVSQAFGQLFAALRDYLDLVAAGVAGASPDPEQAKARSREVRLAWARAEEAVGRSVEEPSSTRVDPDEGRGLLTVAMRVLRALHALRIDAESGNATSSSPELGALVAGCREALDALAGHFASGTDAQWEELRPLYRAARRRLDADGAADSIAVHFDEVVNALNTAAHLIAAAAEPQP